MTYCLANQSIKCLKRQTVVCIAQWQSSRTVHGGSPVQCQVSFRFPFFLIRNLAAFLSRTGGLQLLRGLFQVITISAKVVEARLLAQTSQNDEKMLHFVLESCGVFKAHSTRIGSSLVMQCSYFSDNKLRCIQFGIKSKLC